MNAFVPPSLRHMKALPGSVAPSAPAPASSEVTSAGRSTSTQCQKPDGVGASGSKQVTVKLFVPSGTSLQDSWGELSPAALTWSSLSGWPSVTSSLVTVKDGTWGSRSYGSGLTGRSRVMATPWLDGRSTPKLVRALGAHHGSGT